MKGNGLRKYVVVGAREHRLEVVCGCWVHTFAAVNIHNCAVPVSERDCSCPALIAAPLKDDCFRKILISL